MQLGIRQAVTILYNRLKGLKVGSARTIESLVVESCVGEKHGFLPGDNKVTS